MSNPGVIILSSLNSKKGYFKKFQIEDNIGECVHIHIDSLRIDLSINEFFQLSSLIREALDNLEIIRNFSVNNFDEHFLNAILLSSQRPITVSKKSLAISELNFLVIKRMKYLSIIRKLRIKDTPHFKYFRGKKKEYYSYDQPNYISVNNKERISNLSEVLEEKGYGTDNNYIIKFSGQEIIRDGLHRCAFLAHKFGTEKIIDVLEFDSKNKVNLLKSNIYLNYTIFKCYLKRILKALYLNLSKR